MSFEARHAIPYCLRGLVIAAMVTSLAHAEGPSSSNAPPTTTASRPCPAEARRQFDFWAGDWVVFDGSGKEVGRNRIESILDGCALQERWSGNGQVYGTSLNFYDAADRLWHQVWIDNSGGALYLSGGPTDQGMTLAGTTASPKRPDHRDLQRIAWTRKDDGSVRQIWETSVDDGVTWTIVFDGRYVRAR